MSFYNIYGIDQSKGMLNKAKEKCRNVNFVLGDAVKLEAFDECSFDLIYMIDVIHHIKKAEELFANIY